MPPRKKADTVPTPVEHLRHEDTWANIPTGELAGFVPDEQGTPPVRYARDASLAPRDRRGPAPDRSGRGAASGAGVAGRTPSERILWDLLRAREPGWLAEVPTG